MLHGAAHHLYQDASHSTVQTRSMPDDVRLLATGDLHLGRHPTRVPEELDGQQVSPAAVWTATVDAALERAVDAVLVSGDVVDRENRYVEAYGDFERGARRLDDADVPLLVVAGNHDHDALPDLVGSLDLDGVELLGADGTWERRTIERDGEPVCRVDGWSFPSQHVLRNPLSSYEPAELDDAANSCPAIGLLHADLDATDSDYAPVTTADLRSETADAWLLGHLHAPGVRSDRDPLVLYPGSPQPLDPGEPGTHGPWLLEIDADESGPGPTTVTTEQLPLATLRYDDVAVDVSDVEAATDVTPAVRNRLEDRLRDADVPTTAPECLLARVRLTGRTDVHGELRETADRIESQLGLRRDGLAVRVEAVDVGTRPAIDLEAHAGESTPAAFLAELLLALESAEDDSQGDQSSSHQHSGESPEASTDEQAALTDEQPTLTDEQSALVDDALDRLRETYEASAYRDLRHEGVVDEPDRTDAIATLRERARHLLDQLLEQREVET